MASEPDSPTLSVIVVSYNTRELTRLCLRSIEEHAPAPPGSEVLVVDNASSDGSAEMVRRDFPQVHLLANASNRGFAAANNQAFVEARGEYLLLLNPDTELRPGCLEALLDLARRDPRIGVAGCEVRYPDGRRQSTVFRYLRLSTLAMNLLVPSRWMRRSRWLGRSRYVGLDLGRVQEVEAVAGCFMLVPRAVLETVGGMDERFFMYGEEADWCYRIRRAGWSVVYCPHGSILHHGGQSARQTPAPMLRAMARSQLLFLEKTQGPVAAYVANLLMLLRDLPRALAGPLLPRGIRARYPGLAAGLDASRARVGLHARGLLGAPSRSARRAEPA